MKLHAGNRGVTGTDNGSFADVPLVAFGVINELDLCAVTDSQLLFG